MAFKYDIFAGLGTQEYFLFHSPPNLLSFFHSPQKFDQIMFSLILPGFPMDHLQSHLRVSSDLAHVSLGEPLGQDFEMLKLQETINVLSNQSAQCSSIWTIPVALSRENQLPRVPSEKLKQNNISHDEPARLAV